MEGNKSVPTPGRGQRAQPAGGASLADLLSNASVPGVSPPQGHFGASVASLRGKAYAGSSRADDGAPRPTPMSTSSSQWSSSSQTTGSTSTGMWSPTKPSSSVSSVDSAASFAAHDDPEAIPQKLNIPPPPPQQQQSLPCSVPMYSSMSAPAAPPERMALAASSAYSMDPSDDSFVAMPPSPLYQASRQMGPAFPLSASPTDSELSASPGSYGNVPFAGGSSPVKVHPIHLAGRLDEALLRRGAPGAQPEPADDTQRMLAALASTGLQLGPHDGLGVAGSSFSGPASSWSPPVSMMNTVPMLSLPSMSMAISPAVSPGLISPTPVTTAEARLNEPCMSPAPHRPVAGSAASHAIKHKPSIRRVKDSASSTPVSASSSRWSPPPNALSRKPLKHTASRTALASAAREPQGLKLAASQYESLVRETDRRLHLDSDSHRMQSTTLDGKPTTGCTVTPRRPEPLHSAPMVKANSTPVAASSPAHPLTPPCTAQRQVQAGVGEHATGALPAPMPAATPPAAGAKEPVDDEKMTAAAKHLSNYKLDRSFAKRYEVCEELGTGGFGFVVGVRRRRDNMQAACKFIWKHKIPKHRMVQDPMYGAIPQEAFVLKVVRHPNIVKFIDLYQDESFFYLVMERHGAHWLSKGDKDAPVPSLPAAPVPAPPLPLSVETLSDGSRSSSSTASSGDDTAPALSSLVDRRASCDLFECIEQHSHFPEDQARWIFVQVVEAVYNLAQHGIFHRDIKDENCVIDADLHVKLIDFGSAVITDVRKPQPYFNRFFGTLTFASSEILRGKAYHAAPAEVWSLGVLLSILMTGECPFVDPNAAISGKITKPKFPYSEGAWDVLLACLEVDPEKRITIPQLREHAWVSEAWIGHTRDPAVFHPSLQAFAAPTSAAV